MSYDLGNTDVITYDGSDVEKLNLNGTTIWEKQLLEVNYTAGYDSLSVAITASKSVAYVEYNFQPRHGGLTWKNPYKYDLVYSFDYSAGLAYYQIEYNANDGQGFEPLSGTQYKIYQNSGEGAAAWRLRGWAAVKPLIEANGGSITSFTVTDRSTSGDIVFQNTPANYTAQVKVYYTDGSVEESVAESVSIPSGNISYTATKANVHSRNPFTVAGYGCAYQADLGWSVYQQSGQLYIAIGYMSSVHHGSADQNTLRNATHESLLAEYNEHGPHAADQSPFIENVKLPLTYPEEWIYGQQSKVFGHQGGFAFGNPVISYAASNGWIFAARLKSDGRIEVQMNGRNGTGDDGSTMSLNALNCAFNIVADRPNGTAITPYIFNYE